jgi:ABC-type nitrate/sulfonate/bicarbonate transport system substrate-binding protein
VTCACHWTVNVAASRGHTKLYADLYSVAPAAIFVPANSSIRSPADLAGVPIAVGYQSGSHYATIQALEQYLPPDRIELSFVEGMLFRRMEAFLDGQSPAAALFNGPYYFAEQLGFRKIIDNTFMIAAMINGNPQPEDVHKYFRALRKAQRDIDLRPERHTHYYKREFPERFHSKMDTRRWGPGERIVFEPYSKQAFEQSFDWIKRHAIFEAGNMGPGKYEDAVISIAPLQTASGH